MKDFVPSTPKVGHGDSNKKGDNRKGDYFEIPSEQSIVEEDRSSVKDKNKHVSINLNKNLQDIMILS